MTNKKNLGRIGEELAASFLKKNGFEIIRRNFRYKKIGEIDIILKRDDLIVFVEVKSRNSSCFGGPLYSINKRKIKTLRIVANQFLILNTEYLSFRCRFDMISVQNGKIEWIEDIFR